VSEFQKVKQYKDERLKFCRVAYKNKNPIDRGWPENPLTYEQISNWISEREGNNFGIICGFEGLVVIDCDDEELTRAVEAKLPKTFRVTTGGKSKGSHFYYFCKGLDKKIVFNFQGKHLGEAQFKGTQVVGAGSIHPDTGDRYLVSEDLDIAEISKEDFFEFANLFKEEKKEPNRIEVLNKTTRDSNYNKDAVQLTNVINTTGFSERPDGSLQGTNPWHGSSTGMNLDIKPSTNEGYCHRCNCGINWFQAIALEHGIISNCSDEIPKDRMSEVWKLAEENYGLPKKKKEFKMEKSKLFFDKLELARQFIEVQPLYYDESKMWWIWNFDECRWQMIDEVDLANRVHQILPVNTVKHRERTEMFFALQQVSRTNKPKDAVEWWVQCRDKLIDVKTGKITDATPEYFITNPLPYSLGATPDTPEMDRIFEEWVGKEYVQTLYEIIAYCMIPSYPIQRIFTLLGSGSNGKSKYLELIKQFIGLKGNVTSTELDVLMNSRFEISKLYKKLVCFIGETDFAEMSKTSMLKRLSGGDLIGFEFKNKNPFDDINYAKIIIASNNLPTTSDKTDGFYRRWLIVDFPNKFTERVDILSQIPEREYNNLNRKCVGILSGLLEKREFTNEGTVGERAIRFEEKSNPFDKFWDECVEEGFATEFIFKWEFKQRLNSWCDEHGHRKINDVVISKKMKEKHISFFKTVAKNEFTIDADGYGEKKRYNAWEGIKWQK